MHNFQRLLKSSLVPRWLAVYILLRFTSGTSRDICSFWFSVRLSVCHDSLYAGERQFFGFSAHRQGFISVLCGRLQCKSLLCREREREQESGGFQLCFTAMAGWERPLLCVRRVTDGWGRFLKSWVKVIQHAAYPLNQSFTFPPAVRALAVCYWTGGVWGVSEMRRKKSLLFQFYWMLTVCGLRHMELYLSLHLRLLTTNKYYLYFYEYKCNVFKVNSTIQMFVLKEVSHAHQVCIIWS